MHQSLTSIRAILTLFLIISFSSNSFAESRRFVSEGSDTLMGVGARYVALGGSSVAISDDIYAIYANPAGLASISSAQFSISRQLNSELSPINFAGAAFVLPVLESVGIKTVIGVSYIPRLHFSATGKFAADDLESVFLRYALPGISGDFDGTVTSKTKDYRLAVAFSPVESDRWALGFSVGMVDCATFLCGGNATTTEGVTMATTEATATTFNFGMRYKAADDVTLAFSVRDLRTTLDVHVETTDTEGNTETQRFESSFPTDVSLGMLWNYNDTLDVTMDYQMMFGKYGNYDIDIQMLRLGVEKRYGNLATRYGLVVPIAIKSSRLPEVKLPFPVAPTLGVGWQSDHFDIDLAIYAHPIMSYHKRTVYPSADLSITYRY